MRRLGRILGRLALGVLGILAATWVFGAREPVVVDFTPPDLPPALDPWLAEAEAQVANLRAGVARRIVWADAPDTRTDWAVVYVHGFSATSEEIRPVPDRVAQALGANLYFARLTGHGRDGTAMAAASVQDWTQDYARALAIGRALGDRVIVIATSTGGTLAALAAAQGHAPDAIAFVSPNFGLASAAGALLTAPAARTWLPWIMGEVRRVDVTDPNYLAYWTTEYPVQALLPMAALVRHTTAQDLSAATTPAVFVFSDADRVVSAPKTHAIAGRWGGPVTLSPVTVGQGDDPWSHIIAGDIVSPGMTDEAVQILLDWIAAQ